MASTSASAQASSGTSQPVDVYLQPTGPFVPRSHSFLPLRCGPPIYFPLPSPYDAFCLTGILPSDLNGENGLIGQGGDEKDNGNMEMEAMSSRAEERERLRCLEGVESTGGWEYPVIRRVNEITALITDASARSSVIGTFALRPNSASDGHAGHGAVAGWLLEDVWIAPEERQKGLATLVITYILHSWLLRLPDTPSSVTARTAPDDEAGDKFLSRLGFKRSSDTETVGMESSAAEYVWARH